MIRSTFFVAVCLCMASLTFAQTNFPDSWTGNWKGELQWYRAGVDTPMKVNMELRIHKIDSNTYTWQMIYGSETTDNRPYTLKAIDKKKGHWVTDENNSIVLDQYWVGNKFCGAFTVQNSTIINNFWMENGALIAEFIAIDKKPVATTGGKDADTPPVDSYAVKSYQKAVLHQTK